MDDLPQVGGKNASLGEMIKNLVPKGICVPSGFAVTAQAYRYFLETNKLLEPLTTLLSKIDKKDVRGLQNCAQEIRELIERGQLPEDLATQIARAYQQMEKKYGPSCDVAVRSSATAEDLPHASFAGQQETYLNVRGDKMLLQACKKCFASLFTDRAISYRIDQGFDHMSVLLSIGVQKMIRSDKACSGVIFTLDTESGFKDVIFITSSYGLGESVVQGLVNPDEFFVHKPLLQKGTMPLLKKRLGSKKTKLIYENEMSSKITTVDVSPEDQLRFSLNDDEVLTLAQQALLIEDHYSQRAGRWCPMDIEWGKDGNNDKLYILQARPETVHAIKEPTPYVEEYQVDVSARKKAAVLVRGKSVGNKVVSGPARVIESSEQMHELQQGEILITDMTDPDWEPVLKRAAGIITNRGGRTCHAAIVSRELGIPALVGTVDATTKIATGQTITLDCSQGESGIVYEGQVNFEIIKTKIEHLPELPVNIMLNIAHPDEAFRLAQLPCDGVGLARLEFIISSAIGIHPMALVHPDRVTDTKVHNEIEKRTLGWDDKKRFFVDMLAQEAGTIVAAFYPKPVIVRLSDFKSNEYRQLLGGSFFEPEEENPMLGFRGASRYYHENYREAFALECQAMLKIRMVMGLENIKVMVPFVRTIEEAESVLQLMAQHGLQQGKDGVEIYMMVEVPSNVILIDQFCDLFDGFSIGSNDLTQLVLAVDRDSELIASIFDERNLAVKKMLAMAIAGARSAEKPIGICGQAPSDYPELAQFLIDKGITSISLNPDSLIKTMLMLGKR
jgi:pyruvate,water dikinase